MISRSAKFIFALFIIRVTVAHEENESAHEIVVAHFEDNRPTVIPPSVSEADDHEKSTRKGKGKKKSERYSENSVEWRTDDETWQQYEPPAPAPPPPVVKTTSKGSTPTSSPPTSSNKSQASSQTSSVPNRYITVYPTAAAPRLKGDAAGSMRQTLLLTAAPIMAFALAFIW